LTESAKLEPVLTVGHSNLEIGTFLGLLAALSVHEVVDVRSQPYSRYVPQFNREQLEQALDGLGIAYTFSGREFGARSPDPAAYDDDGRVRYSALRSTHGFERRMLEVVEASRSGRRQALLCTEADPADCHRAVLVAHALHESGAVVEHLHTDGTVESHTGFLDRISGPPDLFSDDEDRFARALAAREHVIAYLNPDIAAAKPRMY
jgi:uncharacterized protein (DUF488 family)